MTSWYTPDAHDQGDVRMRMTLTLFLTAAFGALDLWVGIPTGLVLGLPPVLSGAAATTGALVGATVVTLAGERVQCWIYRRRWFAKRRQRVEHLWNRYGLIGVAFQSPVLAGTLLSTTVALGLGAPARKLLLWMSVSLVFWGTVLTGAAVLGLSIFESGEFLSNP
jgi:membrane protein DedA with SNARE-associated domain